MSRRSALLEAPILEPDRSDTLSGALRRPTLAAALIAPDDALAMASTRARSILGELYGAIGREEDFKTIPEPFRDRVSALRHALETGTPAIVTLTPELCCRGALMHSDAGDYVLVMFESISRGASRRRLDSYRLTRRERQVAELVLDGLGNRAIATRLRVSENTVESHIKRVLTKVHLPSRASFVSKILGGDSD